MVVVATPQIYGTTCGAARTLKSKSKQVEFSCQVAHCRSWKLPTGTGMMISCVYVNRSSEFKPLHQVTAIRCISRGKYRKSQYVISWEHVGRGTMLRLLRIQNFKVWEDTGQISLSPITLFFGANSSGKSSIGQFLMMLKQTAELPDRKVVFFPGTRNSPVQLGSYREMVSQHDESREISFEYLWDLPSSLEVVDTITQQKYGGGQLSFRADVGVAADRSMVLNSYEYSVIDDHPETPRFSIGMKRKSEDKSVYEVTTGDYDLKRKQGRPWSPGPPIRFYGFPDEVIAYHKNAEFVQDLNLQQERLFESVSYLRPLRIEADRLYPWALTMPENVGYKGENTVAAILAARSRKISLPHKRGKLFEEVIAIELKKMGLIEDFKISAISDKRQEYEVKVRTKGSRTLVDLIDVGFGVSQVLPVLVQCFYAPRNSIIIMEQPEIHLHPSAQAALADVMIDVMQSRENGADRNVQLIIETHSEHFLRRLQRRIAEGAVSEKRSRHTLPKSTKCLRSSNRWK